MWRPRMRPPQSQRDGPEAAHRAEQVLGQGRAHLNADDAEQYQGRWRDRAEGTAGQSARGGSGGRGARSPVDVHGGYAWTIDDRAPRYFLLKEAAVYRTLGVAGEEESQLNFLSTRPYCVTCLGGSDAC